ncbi:nucleotidyltransferase domain-containing protein [Peribacillus butanolivorans]
MDKNYSLDLSTISKELTLLLAVLGNENNGKKLSIKNELFTDINWDEFLQLTRHHRVYPLVYSKIKYIEEELIPSHVIQILYQEYKKNTYQMLQLSGEMDLISKLFNENEIRLLFLKGPVIAEEIYGDISLRTSKDLDILISKGDLKKVEKILLNQGYEREEVPATLYDWKWSKHHESYFHTQKKIQIEIHWRLHPAPTKEPSFNELWERKRISLLTNYPVYYLGDEDLFLFLVAHGARHGWFRLRWLVDIDKMIRKRIITRKNGLFKNNQLNYLGRQAIVLSFQLLNTPINEEVQSLTEGKRTRKLAQLTIVYIIEMGRIHFNESKDLLTTYQKHQPHTIKSKLEKSFVLNLYQFSIKSNLQKFVMFIQLLYPSSADVKTLKLPKPLHFLYFPLRPFLWAWRITRKTV